MRLLLDTSVWGRHKHPGIAEWFATALVDGDIAMCHMVALELLHTADNLKRYQALNSDLEAMPWLCMGEREWQRAIQVYGLLAAQPGAFHRSVKHADLLIAATAEIAGIPLVHYDQDYDTIASVTGQSAHWVARRGTL